MQTNLFTNLTQRESFLLSLGEGFSPRLLGGGGFAVELALGDFHSFARGFALGVVGHCSGEERTTDRVEFDDLLGNRLGLIIR